MRRQRQRIAIAQAYATRWQYAEDRDLPDFLCTLNAALARQKNNFNLSVNAKRREIVLRVGRHDFRVKLGLGTNMNGPITDRDVLVFDRRQAP